MKRIHIGAFVVTIIGALSLVSVYVWSIPSSSPMQAILINFGVGLFLLGPVAELASWRIGKTEERAQKAVTAIEGRLRALEQADADAQELMDADLDHDQSLFAAITQPDATGRDLFEALKRAEKLGLIDRKLGVLTPFSENDDHVLRFRRRRGARAISKGVEVLIYNADGSRIQDRTVRQWRRGQSSKDFIRRLNEVARAKRIIGRPKPSTVLQSVTETLNCANYDDETRPILQYFPPQWVLMADKIYAPGHGQSIRHDSVKRDQRRAELQKGKTWIKHESLEEALRVADIYIYSIKPRSGACV